MALFIMNENYEYDEVTAFLESLEQDVDQVMLSEGGGRASRSIVVNDLEDLKSKWKEKQWKNGEAQALKDKEERQLFKAAKQRAAVVDKADQEYNEKLQQNEAQLKKVIESKPRSWVEKKLIQFKAALHRFRSKYGTAKDGKSKTILQKIISTLTRIITWITDKVLKGARFISNKFSGDKRAKKADEFRSKFRAAKVDKRFADTRALSDRNKIVNEYDRRQADRRNAQKSLLQDKMNKLNAKYGTNN